jgi:hypothetical protein
MHMPWSSSYTHTCTHTHTHTHTQALVQQLKEAELDMAKRDAEDSARHMDALVCVCVRGCVCVWLRGMPRIVQGTRMHWCLCVRVCVCVAKRDAKDMDALVCVVYARVLICVYVRVCDWKLSVDSAKHMCVCVTSSLLWTLPLTHTHTHAHTNLSLLHVSGEP